MERLDKIISGNTDLSRKDARRAVASGRVAVNGVTERSFSRHVDPEAESILLDGAEIHCRKYVYYVLNKPKGVLSASRDMKRQTVVDLIPERHRNLFPVGRLDKDTTGLIIITDDGNFAHRVISPASKVEKEYLVGLDKPSASDAVERFANGIALADGTRLKSAVLKMLSDTRASVIIREGRYHQIKRMFAAVGCRVTELHRIRIGGLILAKGQKPGEYIQLDFDEICGKIGIKNNANA